MARRSTSSPTCILSGRAVKLKESVAFAPPAAAGRSTASCKWPSSSPPLPRCEGVSRSRAPADGLGRPGPADGVCEPAPCRRLSVLVREQFLVRNYSRSAGLWLGPAMDWSLDGEAVGHSAAHEAGSLGRRARGHGLGEECGWAAGGWAGPGLLDRQTEVDGWRAWPGAPRTGRVGVGPRPSARGRGRVRGPRLTQLRASCSQMHECQQSPRSDRAHCSPWLVGLGLAGFVLAPATRTKPFRGQHHRSDATRPR